MAETSTFLDELSRLNQQNFLGGLNKIGEEVKALKENQSVANLYNAFRAKTSELQTIDKQITDLNSAKDTQIDFNAPDATTRFAESSAKAMNNLTKVLQSTESYDNLYYPFITAFATLGDEGVRIANSLSKELEGKKQLLEQRSKLPLMQVEQEFNKLQYAKAVRDNLMDDFKFDVLKKEYARNENASQLEGIIRSLPEYNNMPDQASVHSSAKLSVFNKIKNDIRTKALAIAKERGIEVTEQIADIAFQKTLSDDKKLIYSELKPSDYPISQQAQGAADVLANMKFRLNLMETATHIYSNVYNNEMADEKSLLIRGALDKLRNSKGYVNVSKATKDEKLAEEGNMILLSNGEYDALFNKTDGFYTLFSPGGVYDEAQQWMNNNVAGWSNLTKDNGFNKPIVPGTENIMRYKGSGAALNFDGEWVFNPAEIKRQRSLSEEAKKKAIESLNKKSIIPKGEKLPYQPYSWMKYE